MFLLKRIAGKKLDAAEVDYITVKASEVLTRGQCIIEVDGEADGAAASGLIKGVIIGFVDKYGTAKLPGDYSSNGVYTAASSGDTTRAIVCVDKDAIYSAPLDAAAGTTTGSDVDGAVFKILSGGLYLDESTADNGSDDQFVSLGVDSEFGMESNAVLCKILAAKKQD